jgi:hypothetical protein
MHDDRSRWRVGGTQCFYCGERAETDEHWPPKSLTCFGFLLPACKECNNFAGTEYPTNLEARINYVKAKLRHRYKRALDMPEWFPDEIEQEEYNLRVAIERGVELKTETERRLGWSPILYLLQIDESRVAETFRQLRYCPSGNRAVCSLWAYMHPVSLDIALPSLEGEIKRKLEPESRPKPPEPRTIGISFDPSGGGRYSEDRPGQGELTKHEYAAIRAQRVLRQTPEQSSTPKLKRGRPTKNPVTRKQRYDYDRYRQTMAEAVAHGAYGPRDTGPRRPTASNLLETRR